MNGLPFNDIDSSLLRKAIVTVAIQKAKFLAKNPSQDL